MVRPTLAAITTSALMMLNTGLSALIRLVSRRFPEEVRGKRRFQCSGCPAGNVPRPVRPDA
jgi:hypothetical protein